MWVETTTMWFKVGRGSSLELSVRELENQPHEEQQCIMGLRGRSWATGVIISPPPAKLRHVPGPVWKTSRSNQLRA